MVWLAGSLVVWICCLHVVWSFAMDAAGSSALLGAAAMLLAISLAAILPARAVRAGVMVARWLRLGDAVSISLASAGPGPRRRGEARAQMTLLAAVAVAATVGGAISTAAIFPAAGLVARLAGGLTLSSAEWSIVKLGVQFACMVPLAIGITLVFLASAIVRASAGRDSYAAVVRDWLWAAAGGVAVFAACRAGGLNALALACVMPAAVLGGAILALHRRSLAVGGSRRRRPLETPGPARRMAVAAAFAVVAVAVMVQLRLAGDVLAAGMLARACWLVASTAAMAVFIRNVDRKSKPPGRGQEIGAIIGLAAVLLLQASLVIAAFAPAGGRPGGLGGAWSAGLVLCAALAVGLQVPLAGLAAVVLSRQRRLFACAGGRARGYLCCATFGPGAAIVAYFICSQLRPGPLAMSPAAILLIVTALGLCAGGVLAGLRRARLPRRQLQWLIWGVVLMCGLAAALLAAIHRAGAAGGSARPGVWLTSVSGPVGEPGRGLIPGPAMELLPSTEVWRSGRIDRLIWRIFTAGKGQWLAAVDSPSELPQPMRSSRRVTFACPDPTAWPASWSATAGRRPARSMYDYGYIRRSGFDGLLLACGPAGSPDGWRFYNGRTAARLASCLLPADPRSPAGRRGPAVLRIQARGAGLARALGAIKAFDRAVGPCVFAADRRAEAVDIVVVTARDMPADFPANLPAGTPAGLPGSPANSPIESPAGSPAGSAAGDWFVTARVDLLWYYWPGITPTGILVADVGLRRGPDVRDFVASLRPVLAAGRGPSALFPRPVWHWRNQLSDPGIASPSR